MSVVESVGVPLITPVAVLSVNPAGKLGVIVNRFGAPMSVGVIVVADPIASELFVNE